MTSAFARRVLVSCCALSAIVLSERTMMAVETAPATAPAAIPPTESAALGVLRDVMKNETKFVKVHAAEALIELKATDGVRETFLAEEPANREVPSYRLGIWRVLARTATDDADRAKWVGEIKRQAFDPAAPDRLAAVESLAKLSYALTPEEGPAIAALANGDQEGFAIFARWLLAQTPEGLDGAQNFFAKYLDSKDPITRLRAIYVLRFMPALTEANRAKLMAAAKAEPQGTLTHAYATSSAFIVAKTYGDEWNARRATAILYQILETGAPTEKQEACRALGERGDASDVPAIAPLLSDANPPARVGAGLAIARILRLPTKQ